MKKILSFVFCFLLCTSSLLVHAADSEYTVDEIGISINIPDSFYVFTRDTLPEDEKFAAMGISYEGMMSLFEQESIYLEAMNTESFNELVVICEQTDESNYFDMGVDGLYNAIVAQEKELEKSGRTVVDADLFESNGIDFVKIYSDYQNSRIQYSTVYNGKRYEIRYTDFDGDITGDEDESIDELVESLKFTQKPAKAVDAEKKDRAEPIPESRSVASEPAKASEPEDDGVMGGLIDIMIFIGLGIVACTLPALIFRFIFVRSGLGKTASFWITLVYSIAMTAVFYYAIIKLNIDTIGSYLCLIPLIWGIVIYKIVKYR